jgi:hypothetical protein
VRWKRRRKRREKPCDAEQKRTTKQRGKKAWPSKLL